jgi:hypothetical protein
MAALPHIIQLRGPWETTDSATDAGERASMPVFVDFAARDRPRVVEVRRSFHWVAEPRPHERVYLVLDEWLGRPEVRLNGRRIEEPSNDVPRRFDVSNLLESRNDLAVRFHVSPAAVDGAGPSPTPLFRAPPFLSIESAGARVVFVAIELHEPDATESLILEAVIEAADGPAKNLELQVELGDVLRAVPVSMRTQGRSDVRVSIPPVDLAPWRPRWLGPPVLHPLRLRLTEGSTVLHEQAWQVGLRDVEICGETEGRLRVRCGGQEAPLECSPYSVKQLFQPNLGYSAGVAVDDWDVVRGNALDLSATAAPDDAYECLDRLGLFWLASPRAAGRPHRYWRRFGRHPSMVIVKKKGGAEPL